MRRFFGFTLGLAGLIVLIGSASPMPAEEETAQALKTKDERLQVAISVDWIEKPLHEAMNDIIAQIKAVGLGIIDVRFDSDVAPDQKITFAAKNQSVAEVLDAALRKLELGYSVISKKDDPFDGSLLLKKGSERAVAVTDPKAEPKTKSKAKGSDEPETPGVTKETKEQQAASKLKLIKQLIEAGKKEKARERLRDLIKMHPESKVIPEAKELLEKLG